MPYKRKGYRRRRRAPWYRRKYNALQLAAKAMKGVRYVKGLVNSEMFNTTQAASAAVTNTGTFVNLVQVNKVMDSLVELVFLSFVEIFYVDLYLS